MWLEVRVNIGDQWQFDRGSKRSAASAASAVPRRRSPSAAHDTMADAEEKKGDITDSAPAPEVQPPSTQDVADALKVRAPPRGRARATARRATARPTPLALS